MVKVTGPMMSLSASGTLADTVTFSTWKGRAYVRERVIPANPQSDAQVGRRAMLSFLTKAWSARSAANKATWQDLAEQLISSNFNAYLSEGMTGWHNFLAPSAITPATRSHDASDNWIDAAAYEENRIKITMSGSALNHSWGEIIFAQEGAGITASVGTTILVQPDTTIAEHFIFWTPPKVAQYTFDNMAFSYDGKKGMFGGDVTANPP